VLSFVTPSYAETVEPAPEPGATVEGTEAHGGGGHGAFPPFDPSTFGSQVFWLVVCFGALYLLMSRVALPRIGSILADRDNRIARDLADAGKLKEATDAAIAAYEQALAAARQNAHAIAQTARNEARAAIDADRARIEAELQQRLDAAEARIGEVKARALSEVDAIAKDAAAAMVETLVGSAAGEAELAGAVKAALAERT
jgi:F-type H+-transporting ATPase subunit b